MFPTRLMWICLKPAPNNMKMSLVDPPNDHLTTYYETLAILTKFVPETKNAGTILGTIDRAAFGQHGYSAGEKTIAFR